MKYDHDVVMEVFNHYVTLSHGQWPDPSTEDNKVRRPGVMYHAPFENPCIMAAEIGRRVKMCGLDGLVVEIVYGILLGVAWGAEFYAQEYHHDLNDVYSKINRVAWYCTDKEFYKGLPYRTWKRENYDSRKIRGGYNV